MSKSVIVYFIPDEVNSPSNHPYPLPDLIVDEDPEKHKGNTENSPRAHGHLKETMHQTLVTYLTRHLN